jgi:hypothetical protein
MFEIADAYEVMMGRWSRQLAPLFVDFAGVQEGESDAAPDRFPRCWLE